MAQLPSKTLSLFLVVVIRLVAGYCVWYCWRALCGSSQFASTHSIIRSFEFSPCKCSSRSTDTSLQGTAISNQYSRHFVFTRVTRIKSTLHIRSFHELLSFTSPIIVLISRPSTLLDTMWTTLLPTLLLLQSLAVQAQITQTITKTAPCEPLPTDSSINSVILLGYNLNGCPTVPNFGANIRSIIGCNPITNTGITNVVVITNEELPPTCVLTLYADSDCLGTSSAEIGPILPISHPSACIGPIRNPAGELFVAKGATLDC